MQCRWNEPPEPASTADGQDREQRDVQARYRDQVRRARGIEYAPLLARHAACVPDGQRRDQRAGVAVVDPSRDALRDTLAKSAEWCSACRETLVQA
jgi:hypothetical protein